MSVGFLVEDIDPLCGSIFRKNDGGVSPSAKTEAAVFLLDQAGCETRDDHDDPIATIATREGDYIIRAVPFCLQRDVSAFQEHRRMMLAKLQAKLSDMHLDAPVLPICGQARRRALAM